jgi:YD repeat-containing protein
MEDRTLLSTMNWINPSGGDWDVASNWVNAANSSDYHVPTSSDDAVINFTGITVTHGSGTSDDSANSLTSQASLDLSNGSLSLATSSTISGNFTMSGGTLTGSGDLTISGAMTWTLGTISGRGVINTNGGLTLGGPTDVAGEDLTGRTLNNAGAATLAAEGSSSGLFLSSGATFDNKPGASFTNLTDAGILDRGGAASTFLNEGRFVKAGTGFMDISVAFDQTGAGTTQVQAGTLGLDGGGTIAGTGTLSPAPGATLDFGSGTITIASTSGITGGGAVHFNSGTVNDAGCYNITGSTLVSGSSAVMANLTGPVASLGRSLMISTGTLNLSGGVPINVQTLSLSDGTLTGSDPLTVSGAMSWTGGTISGRGVINANGGLALGGGPGVAIGETLSGRTLNNAGAATLAPSNSSLSLSLDSGALFDNKPGASFTFQNDAGIVDGGGATSTFLNEGTLTKAGGTGYTGISVAFNNGPNGLVQVLTGKLRLAAGTLDVSGLGIVNTRDAATLDLSGGLTGTTRNVDRYAPQGALVINGPGSSASPEPLEVMSQDLGNVPAGFFHNFAYGSITLGNTAYVRLVDKAHNSTGTGAEALYVNTLVVPLGTTLDLNGLHVYAIASEIDGTLNGGTISELPSGGPIPLGTPAPGNITSAGAVDDWTFFGRGGHAVTVVVNPGSGPAPAPLDPHIDNVTVNVLDSNGNVLGSVTSSTPGATVTIPGVALPVDGTYHVRVQASPDDLTGTGRYEITVNDATVNVAPASFNQEYNGSLATSYSVDRWTFSATAGQQIRFNLLAAATPTIEFTLTGPNGYVAFHDLTASSDPITLPSSGSYALSVDALSGQAGAYAFRLDQTALTNLTLGTTYQGLLAGNGQPQLFRVDLATTESLLVVLRDASAADHNELYLKFGAPPTRSDYQYRFSTPASANQQVLAPAAAAGTWYILLYAELVPAPSSYTITATPGAIFLTGVTPDHAGNGVVTTLTLTGSGFDPLTTVSLIAADGTVYPAATTSIDLPTQITATFAAGSVPAGAYTVRADKPGVAPADIPDGLTVTAGGQSVLQTQIILPATLGRHATATLYVEYTNTGTIAMPAPLLVLSGTLNPLLTLDATRILPGFWTSANPDAFNHTVEILGSGATPGVLQPGETMRVPVYYAGLQRPWVSTNTVTFNLTVTNPDDTTPIDWASLRDGLRPPGIDPVAWASIYADVVSQIGPKWGDFVARIDADASYLGRLGEHVTDVSQLWQFEIRQAIGMAPIGQVASDVDVSIPAPGFPLTVSRSYSPSILDRSTVGPFGVGWTLDGGWQRTLTKLTDGTVVVADSGGSIRRFQPDSRNSSYFDQPGDHGILIANADGTFSIRELDGQVTHFLADGRVDYVQDTNGNRITADYTNGLLTGLTHSDGQSIQIAYNAAGRIAEVTDPYGRTTTFIYDASNMHLLSARDYDGATHTYTYDLGSNPATQNALLSIAHPDGLHQAFSYDTEGRLSGVAENDGSDPITIAYGPYGLVSLTDATNDTTQLYLDNRGLLVKTVDPLGNANYLTFDSSYNLTQFTDAASRSYQLTYDNQGNLTSATDPLGATTKFTYTSPLDRLASLTDANSNLTSYAYDAQANLTATTYADGSVERATYDAQGNPTTTTKRLSGIFSL